jgi:hypothetical protein
MEQGYDMGRNAQHVVPRDGKWAVRKGGSDRVTRVFETQGEAVAAGRDIARNQRSELVIHGADGLIRERRSSGNDPFPPKG